MKNTIVYYQLKRPDGLFSAEKQLRTVVKSNLDIDDIVEAREYFKELISESENVEMKSIKVNTFKIMR